MFTTEQKLAALHYALVTSDKFDAVFSGMIANYEQHIPRLVVAALGTYCPYNCLHEPSPSLGGEPCATCEELLEALAPFR